MSKERERRTSRTELRVAASGDGGKLMGCAVSYNCLSGPIPGSRAGKFRERIMPGAFSASLKRGDTVFCLMNHDPSRVMGSTRNATLRLRETDSGLYFECDLPDTTDAQDLRKLVQRGDIDSCSFGFEDVEDTWGIGEDEDGDRCAIRSVVSAKLFDVSAVAMPAYTSGTSVSARSRATDYAITRLSDAEEKEIWRRAFALQLRREGF
ncbi:MAG TPA: HK97 family phage prohead protease [Verrucomicrobiae bacterium]|nr:HK97 family phage prohead protease [Verrucomicrobiae bacterium]